MTNRGNQDEPTTIQIERSTLRWGSLILGAIALLVMVVTILVTPGFEFNTVSYVALAVAVVGVAGFVLFDPQALAEAITGRRGQYLLSSYLLTIFFVAAIIAIFVVIRQAELDPWDIAENSEYQLTQESLDLLAELEEPIEIIAFYGRTSSPEQREEAEIWFNIYERDSDGMVTYRFVDPDRNPVEALEYGAGSGGNTIVLTQGDRTADVFLPNERNISGGIVQVLLGDPLTAYIVTGHGERNFNDFQPEGYGTFRNAMEASNYTIEEINLATTDQVPDDADVLIIAGPISQFVPQEIAVLDDYLEAGGGVLLMADPGGETGGLAGGIRSVAFAPNGDLFASGGSDSTAKIWDADSQEELLTLRGHTGEVLNIAFSPEADQLATVGADGSVRVWDVDSGDEIAVLDGHPQSQAADVIFSSDGALLISAGEDRTIHVWDTEGFEELPYSPIDTTHALFSVDVTPDSSTILAGGCQSENPNSPGEGILVAYNTEDGTQLLEERIHGDAILGVEILPAAVAEEAEAEEDAEAVEETAPAGEELAGLLVQTIAVDGSIGTFNLSEQEGSTVSPYEPSITAVSIAPDGTRAFGLVNPETLSIRLWPAGDNSANNETVLEGPTDIIWDADFSADSETLIVGSRDGNLYVFDVTDAEAEPFVITGPHAAIDPLYTYFEEEWGIVVNDDLLVDIATVSELGSELTPVIREYGASPITDGFADQGRPIFVILGHSVTRSLLPPEDVSLVELAQTNSPDLFGQTVSWAEQSDPLTAPIALDPGVDLQGPVPVAISGEKAEQSARVVVVGDADIVSNNALNATTYNNERFILNSLSWVADSEAALDLPDREFDVREFDQPFESASLILVGISITCLLPLFILIAGIVTWVQRRRRR